jgi:uncharacterized membrane protein YfcA
VRNRSNRNVDLRIAMVVGVTGAISAVFGGIAAEQMSARLSNGLFALLLLFVAITQLMTLRTPEAE